MNPQAAIGSLQGTQQVQQQGGLSYIGNPDFRGYLNYLALSTGNNTAQKFLGQGIGNDARFAGGTTNTAAQGLYNQYLGLTGANTSSSPTINIPGPYIPPVAPTSAINYAQNLYQGALANAQNPNNSNSATALYNKYLNQYLQQEQVGITTQKTQNQAELANLQAQLANTLQGTQLQRQATTQNTALTEANIGRERQNYQQQQGLEGEQAMRSLQAQQGQAGLAGSGVAGQQQYLANQDRAIKESAQEGQYTYSTNQQELFKNQTMLQLANSDDLSKLKETEGENAANFSLADYLNQAAANEVQFRITNEQQAQQAVLQQATQSYNTQLVNWLNSAYGKNAPMYSAIYQAVKR